MTELTVKLFWISIILILEPTLVSVWPKVRAGFFLTYPYRANQAARIELYYDGLSRPMRIMSPLRIKIRKWAMRIGILMLIALSSNQVYHFFNV